LAKVALPAEDLQLDSRGCPTNLPLQLTTFVGRGTELAEVTRLLAAARLVTLVGAGGVGKTRLALRVAEDLLESYADGVWLVELAPLGDPADVPRTVAAAVGVYESAGQSFSQLLARSFQSRQLLLVMDNCEHLVGACAELADYLLRACPHLTVLMTSRQPLGVGGEIIWRVPSLGTPDPRVRMGTDEVAESEAVRLFVDRAQTVLPGFAVDDFSAATVAEICRRLEGIPLALELAAARLNGIRITSVLRPTPARRPVGRGRTARAHCAPR